MNKVGRPSKLTNEEKTRVVSLYIVDKESTTNISKMVGVSSSTITNILISRGIVLRSGPESNKLSTKFSFKEMNEEKSFLLGLIYGDGSISIRKDYVNITSGDLDILRKSQLILGQKFKISKVKNSNCHRGVIYSHKICDELFELFTLVNNKSDKLIFPFLDECMMASFISGYLATDGCVSINQKDNLLTLSFYSCSKNFLDDLNMYICNKIQIAPRNVSLRKFNETSGHLGKRKLYYLAFNGVKAEKCCNFIFGSVSENTRCERKFLVFKKFMERKYGTGI